MRRSRPRGAVTPVFDTLPFEAGIVDQRISWEKNPANAGKLVLTALMAEFYGLLVSAT